MKYSCESCDIKCEINIKTDKEQPFIVSVNKCLMARGNKVVKWRERNEGL